MLVAGSSRAKVRDTIRRMSGPAAPASSPLAGKRMVIAGLSRLAVRITQLLAVGGADAVVVTDDDPSTLAGSLGPSVRVIQVEGDLEDALRRADLPGADCLLAVADDDLANLRSTLAAREVAPHVPVVLRTFDATLADHLERTLGVRRAFSASSLAAPSFVVAAMGGTVLESLRLGPGAVTICRIDVEDRSDLAGSTALQAKVQHGCAVLGQGGPDGSWEPVLGDGADRILTPGQPVAVGGLLVDVLRLAKLGSLWGRTRDRPKRRRPRRSPDERRRDEDQRRTLGRTLLPAATIGFGSLLVLTMVVFGVTQHLGPVDALFTAVSTAFGSPTVGSSNSWLKIFAVAAMVAGGALVGVLFAWVAAVATTERLEERMGRRARHLSGHAVVAGLGRVGWEVERLLYALHIPTVIVEMAPDPRFMGTVSERTPVLSGDVRLPENLERARIHEAKVFLACTSDDLANIEACIQAKRLNPDVRTVARIFDDSVATRVGGALGIDVAVSTTRVAARAFVGAALDERSFRAFDIQETPYLAFRYEAPSDTATTVLDGWRDGGVRILAHQDRSGEMHPPSALGDVIGAGERLILAGPADAVRRLVLGEAPAPTPVRTTP